MRIQQIIHWGSYTEFRFIDQTPEDVHHLREYLETRLGHPLDLDYQDKGEFSYMDEDSNGLFHFPYKDYLVTCVYIEHSTGLLREFQRSMGSTS